MLGSMHPMLEILRAMILAVAVRISQQTQDVDTIPCYFVSEGLVWAFLLLLLGWISLYEGYYFCGLLHMCLLESECEHRVKDLRWPTIGCSKLALNRDGRLCDEGGCGFCRC